ncbi:MAG: Nif3-like dinuclear metal center hexameric protein [Prevotellaceae bacterium]|jgi:dinuclear metal center YbgI/SA1388 family protein|nr:Nif3-like dinuclear metal center hexameric protein [Prevotellaceae bacterium]
MIKVADICQLIDDFAPPALQENYDNAGLLIGSPEMTVSGALICIDVTKEVVNEAITKNCNLIIAHHPLIFKGLKKINGSDDTQRAVIEAIKKDIAIYAAHTNIDSVIGGVSGRMAEKLHLKNIEILQQREPEDNTVGFGVVGDLENPAEATFFLEQIKSIFNVQCVRHTALLQQLIKRVAVCGGAGSFLIDAAKKAKADIFITGDVKYHDFFLADNQLIIADIGHYESEQFTKEIFYEIISKKIPNFAVRISDTKTNPVNYF